MTHPDAPSNASGPWYVNSGVGWPVFRGPYMQKDAKLACFLLKADAQQLQALCDKYLNDPMGPNAPYRYLAPLPYTTLIYADMQVYSLNDQDQNVGWMREIDLSFWVLTLAMRRGSGGYDELDHVAFFLPYLFVDNSYAIATGREVYGFMKAEGTFTPVTDIHTPEFSVKTLAFPTLSSTTQGTVQELLRVEKLSSPIIGELAHDWADYSEAGSAILKLLTGSPIGELAIEGLANKLNLSDHLGIDVPVVFLKQFRDIADTNKAAYQAIVKAPATLQAFHGGGVIFERYQLVLNELESHPIAQTLGLDMHNNCQEASAVGWMNIDFPMQEGVELWRAKPIPQKMATLGGGTGSLATPQKVAILGGGMGSLATAFALTDQPGWQDKYDITVYQLGWRVGGKGASGRDPDNGQRIEEHGLHVWFGWYDNAFDVMQKCYAELARPYDAPLSRWDQAFQPHNYFVLRELINGQWLNWPVSMPINSDTPGKHDAERSIWQFIQMIIGTMHQATAAHPAFQRALAREDPIHLAVDLVDSLLEKVKIDLIKDQASPHKVLAKLGDAHQRAQALQSGEVRPHSHAHNDLSSIFTELIEMLAALRADLAEFDLDLRRLLLLLELGAVNIVGMLCEDLILNGFASIDKMDYRAWLHKWNASDDVMYSAPVRMIYDLAFAYPKGDTGDKEPCETGNMGAGTLLHSALLIAFGYRGAMAWKMQGGMGDVVFAPLYQVLKARGVKFEFFTKVTDLVPDPVTGTIAEIVVDRQVTLKPKLAAYNPLITVDGLPCWPRRPLYAQLEQGDALKKADANLESYWTDWQPAQPNVHLKQGQDFDIVVLGISLGALPYICAKLTDKSYNPGSYQRWQDMFEKVPTVQTQAMQLWLKPAVTALGWPLASPLLGSYAQPFSTWADMSQTLPREDWPAGSTPQDVAYFCGPLKETIIAPFSDPTFPAKEKERVKQSALEWIKQNIGRLWLATLIKGDFDYNLLVDLDERAGAARFDGQYWRANIDPTERYVLSVAGSNEYRMKTDGSGLKKLYLTGDWIDNGFLNAGSAEPATIAGLQAARAISGYPEHITGASII